MVTTRDRIIAATNELFRRNGYNATSLSQISNASGATVGSIYHFFPGGKEALGVAVIDTTGNVYRELFQSFATDPADPVGAFHAFFTGAARVLEESDYIDPCPIGTIAREVANTSEPLRVAAEQAFKSWITAARQYLTHAGIESDEADNLATAFVINVEGAFVLCRTLRTTAPLDAVDQLVANSINHALETTTTSTTSPRP